MLLVSGRNPTVMLEPIGHHNASLRPMADALSLAIMYGWIGQDDKIHNLHQHSVGQGSFALHLADGRQYHFRAAGTRVVVKDAWFVGSPVEVLRTPKQCISFIDGLQRPRKKHPKAA